MLNQLSSGDVKLNLYSDDPPSSPVTIVNWKVLEGIEDKGLSLFRVYNKLNQYKRTRQLQPLITEMTKHFEAGDFPVIFSQRYLTDSMSQTGVSIDNLLYQFAKAGLDEGKPGETLSLDACNMCLYLAHISPFLCDKLLNAVNTAGCQAEDEHKRLIARAQAALGKYAASKSQGRLFDATQTASSKAAQFLTSAPVAEDKADKLVKAAENMSLSEAEKVEKADEKTPIHALMEENKQNYSEDDCKHAVINFCGKSEQLQKEIMKMSLRPLSEEVFNLSLYQDFSAEDTFSGYRDWVEHSIGWHLVFTVLQSGRGDFVDVKKTANKGQAAAEPEKRYHVKSDSQTPQFKFILHRRSLSISGHPIHETEILNRPAKSSPVSVERKSTAVPFPAVPLLRPQSYSSRQYQQAILRCEDYITKYTNILSLQPHLISKFFYKTIDENEYMTNAHRDRSEKIRYIISMMRESPERCVSFYEAIENEREHLGHECIREKIDEKLRAPESSGPETGAD